MSGYTKNIESLLDNILRLHIQNRTQTWEYMTFCVRADDNDPDGIDEEYDSQQITDTYPLTDTLNELGEEGWELVGMSPLREKFDKAADDGCKEYEIEYVLKRQKDRWD